MRLSHFLLIYIVLLIVDYNDLIKIPDLVFTILHWVIGVITVLFVLAVLVFKPSKVSWKL